jgi:hypothetical protein
MDAPRGRRAPPSFRDAQGALVEPGDMRSVRARADSGAVRTVRLFHRRGEGWTEGTGVAGPYETLALPVGAYDLVWNANGDGGPVFASARAIVRLREVVEVDLVRAPERR